jgi:hypothetical protein
LGSAAQAVVLHADHGNAEPDDVDVVAVSKHSDEQEPDHWFVRKVRRLSSLCLTTTPKLTWRLIPQFIVAVSKHSDDDANDELRY